MLQSILDNDLYKFSMSYAYMKLYENAEGTFTFIDRNSDIVADESYIHDFISYVTVQFSHCVLQNDEFKWAVSKMYYIPEFYWEWLRSFRYDVKKMRIYADKDKHLCIEVTDKIYRSTLYEVPVLAMVSEFNNARNGRTVDYDAMIDRLDTKIQMSNENGLVFSEFGTRRRFSFDVQDAVVNRIKHTAKFCSGTSNVYLAFKYDMTPIGTVAHEFVMFHGANWGYREANYKAYEAWARVYDGSLGIALTDTYTTDAFFNNFSLSQAKLFDGIRQDSGDEYEFTDRAIKYYTDRRIDPSTKTIVFSNALTMPKFLDINLYCKEKGIKATAGIGTNLSNDTEHKPYNIVMKLTMCRLNNKTPMRPCIKISDDKGKYLGPESEFETAKRDLNLNI